MRDPKTPEQREHKSWDRWFRWVKPEFCPLLLEFAGKPNLVYVEIGCWAGASAEWVARNVLTHPTSLGFGLDPYFPDPPKHPKEKVERVRQRAIDRIAFMGDRWCWRRQPSQVVLRDWPAEIPIDVLYVDGCHDAHGVVCDFALAGPHLKGGSLVVFDDYTPSTPKHRPNVKEGFDAIMAAWAGQLREVGEHAGGRQRAVQVDRKW